MFFWRKQCKKQIIERNEINLELSKFELNSVLNKSDGSLKFIEMPELSVQLTEELSVIDINVK